MYLAARREKEVLISSVAGNFLAAEHIEYKDIFKQVMSSPPTPTVGLAALIAAIELGSYFSTSSLQQLFRNLSTNSTDKKLVYQMSC